MRCNRPTWYRDGLGRQTDFAYNAAGQLTERTDPADADGVRKKTYTTYDTTGISRPRVVRVCGATTTCNTNEEIRTEYDYWGNTLLPSVVRRIDAARGETLVTTNAYDDAGRLLMSDGPLPGTSDATYYLYDQFGRKIWEMGAADRRAHGVRRRPRTATPTTRCIAVEVGNVTSVTMPVLTPLTRTETEYDSRRNPTVERVLGRGHDVHPDPADVRRPRTGHLRSAAHEHGRVRFSPLRDACTLGVPGAFGDDRITRNVYDNASQLRQVQRADGTSIQQNYATYTYTLNGKQQTVKDANGNLTTYEYDGFDRMSKMRFPVATPGAGTSSTTDYEQYGYDTVGNRTSLRKRDGKTITYVFDGLNRVRSKTVPVSTGGAAGYSVCYGVRGARVADVRPVRLAPRARASPTSTTGSGGSVPSSTNMDGTSRPVTYDYDAHGNRTRITHPDSKFFEYAYEPTDNLHVHLGEWPVGRWSRTSTTSSAVATGSTATRAGSVTAILFDEISRLKLDRPQPRRQTPPPTTSASGSRTTRRARWSRARRRTASTTYPIAAVNQTYTSNGRNQYTQIAAPAADLELGRKRQPDLGRAATPTTFAYDTENRLTGASGAKTATLTYDPLGGCTRCRTPRAPRGSCTTATG